MSLGLVVGSTHRGRSLRKVGSMVVRGITVSSGAYRPNQCRRGRPPGSCRVTAHRCSRAFNRPTGTRAAPPVGARHAPPGSPCGILIQPIPSTRHALRAIAIRDDRLTVKPGGAQGRHVRCARGWPRTAGSPPRTPARWGATVPPRVARRAVPVTVFLRPEHDVGLFVDRTRHRTQHVAETGHYYEWVRSDKVELP